MKLLTLNTHSLMETEYPAKLEIFAEMAAAERPDIIALQEVNQHMDGEEADLSLAPGYCPCTDKPIRADNHVYNAVRLLAEKGISCYWTWLPVKIGYGQFDEGLALISFSPITGTDVCTVSARDDYADWRTRKILGITTEKRPGAWFYCVHYGWWNDENEPFAAQWQKTAAHLPSDCPVWLMGDFNSPAEVRGKGYDLVRASGWRDSWENAYVRDDGITVYKNIAGWENNTGGIRVDQIWHNRDVRAERSFVICNDRWYPVISDHFGVIAEYNEGCETE
ncbi:MAG: exodeoxyribonuclease III [Ruminococcaceae bacterium]|nr:exodeoxyribonuclease III [Oscillospiraceae bacterium]